MEDGTKTVSWPVRLSVQNRRGLFKAECSSLLRRGCQMSQISYKIEQMSPQQKARRLRKVMSQHQIRFNHTTYCYTCKLTFTNSNVTYSSVIKQVVWNKSSLLL